MRRLALAAALFGSVALLVVDFGLSPIFDYRIDQPDFYTY